MSEPRECDLVQGEGSVSLLTLADGPRVDKGVRLRVIEKSAHDAVVKQLAAVSKERDELRLAKPNSGSTDTLTEKYDLRRQLAAVTRERDELKAKPSTFIKLDETTEAFVQTRATIANMEMFQKDVILLGQQLAAEKERADRLEREILIRDRDAQRDGMRRAEYWREFDGERAALIKNRDALAEKLKAAIAEIDTWKDRAAINGKRGFELQDERDRFCAEVECLKTQCERLERENVAYFNALQEVTEKGHADCEYCLKHDRIATRVLAAYRRGNWE